MSKVLIRLSRMNQMILFSVFLFASVDGSQKLLNICSNVAERMYACFNIRKSMCTVMPKKSEKARRQFISSQWHSPTSFGSNLAEKFTDV